MEIIKQLTSKKNDVYLVNYNNNYAIKKVFSNIKMYYQEKEFYQQNSKSLTGKYRIPGLLSYNDNSQQLLIEYISGETLLSNLEKLEINLAYKEAYEAIIDLINWLVYFSNIGYVCENRLSFFDVNFRNFIVNDKAIYGIDFEDISPGCLKKDIIKALAMYLNYRPTFSEFKYNVCGQVIAYLVERGVFALTDIRYIGKEIKVIQSRRAIKQE